jgi:uncharacterized protein YuzE
MRLTYDPGSDMLSIRLRAGKIARSEDIEDGVELLYDEAGHVLGFNFADARQRMTVEELTTVTYENVATKLRGSLRLP